MLSKDKILNGPFEFELFDDTDPTPVSVIAFTGLKKDSVKFDVENEEYSDDIEDGSKDQGYYGKNAVCELTISELDPTDLATIEGGTAVTGEIRFTAKGKKVVLAAMDSIGVKVENFKTKITIKKSLAIGEAITNAFTVSAI